MTEPREHPPSGTIAEGDESPHVSFLELARGFMEFHNALKASLGPTNRTGTPRLRKKPATPIVQIATGLVETQKRLQVALEPLAREIEESPAGQFFRGYVAFPRMARLLLSEWADSDRPAIADRRSSQYAFEPSFPYSPYDASFPELLTVYGAHKRPEIQERMERAVMAGDRDAADEAWLELKEATQLSWEASEAGRTRAQCRTRWRESKTPPTFDEGCTIVTPLLEAVEGARSHPRTAKDAARACAKNWFLGGRDPGQLELIIDESRSNSMTWDAVGFIGKWLGNSEDHHARSMLTRSTMWRFITGGGVGRPPSKMGRPKSIFGSFTVYKATQELVDLGMRATSSEATVDGKSACDVVAAVLGCSFSTAQKAWLKFRNRKGMEYLRQIGLEGDPDRLSEDFDNSIPDTPAFVIARHHWRSLYGSDSQ